MENNTINTTNGQKRILVVEDEFYLGDIYCVILRKSGFIVDLASNGREGLEKATLMPNLILLDIMLPELNGLEVLKRLKENPQTAHIPVVLITNLGQQDIIKQAFNLGAQGYLLKVRINPKGLVEEISRFLVDPNYKMDINSIPFD